MDFTDACSLYCSSECRLQDKGGSPALKPENAPVKLSSQLPMALSPLVRPTHHISPSPRMPAHGHTDSSSSSSITSSPIESPFTGPLPGSPRKGSFNLPPLAYPAQTMSSSIPVKIPMLPRAPIPLAAESSSHHSPYHGASVDTLRFGRKPGLTNTVISPNALAPRCACGKVAGHRRTSKDRNAEVALPNFALGPARGELCGSFNKRLVSDPLVKMSATRSHSGHGAPGIADLELSTSFGAALSLTRSRSDPTPSSPMARKTSADFLQHVVSANRSRSGTVAGSPGRGRSRERQRHPVEQPTHVLNHSKEREEAPSRSRHRQELPRRSIEPVQEYVAPAPEYPRITPSWSRPTRAPELDVGQGLAPSPRLAAAKRPPLASPTKPGSGRMSPADVREQADESTRKQDMLDRAQGEIGLTVGMFSGGRVASDLSGV